MNEFVKVYEHEGRYYISGFDYVKLMNVEMGIDSQMGYYLIDNSILEKMRDGNYRIQEEKMQDHQIIKIQQDYRDKYGDTLQRMRNFSYDDLLSWKKNLDKYRDMEDFDPQIYTMLEEEIKKRTEAIDTKEEVLYKMLAYLDELKDEYGEELVAECIPKLPGEWKKSQESNKVHK